MDSLPAEVILRILKTISSPKTIQECKLISKTFNHIICRNYVNLARAQCAVTFLFGANLKIQVQHTNSGKIACLEDLQEQRETLKYVLALKFSSIELCSFKFIGSQESENDTSLLHQILLVLQLTKQFCIRIFNVQDINLKDKKLCRKLFNLMLQKDCQQIIFNNCHFNNVTIQNCCIPHQFFPVNQLIRHFAYCLRHKPKNNIPFCVKVSEVTPKSICQFNWIHLSEAPFFELQVEKCSLTLLDEIVEEAENESLSQLHLEFPSLAHPTAHLKIKFNTVDRTLRVFPIVDVPARFVGQSICYARFYRDF
uniref:F-box domain-containing protein n=1 Tax=Ditylenchus dipsaci TaxID=166011 RepID=A0A915DAC1_9BILA